MSQPKNSKILAFAGSARSGSFNKQFVQAAAALAEQLGGSVTFIDLADFPAPVLNVDDQSASGIPEKMRKFKDLLKAHDALIISSPENNGSLSALLKNTLDWCSRKEENESPGVCFAGKPTLLLAASPGALGGLRGLNSVRTVMTDLKALVLPEQMALSRAGSAFADDGSLLDKGNAERLQAMIERLLDVTRKLSV
jgi:NAD(P)H-dependent FMN reductase